jgi:hypothetical protein
MSESQQQHYVGPKTKSIRATSQKWKANLRNECLKRAKSARRHLLIKRRRGCEAIINPNEHIMGTPTNTNSSLGCKEVKCEVIDSYNDFGQHEKQIWPNKMKYYHPEERDNSLHLTAKQMVEQEIQRSMIELDSCHLQSVRQNNAASNVNEEYSNAMFISWSDDDSKHQEYGELLRRNEATGEEEFKMSEVDFAELLNDVAEELQREGTCLMLALNSNIHMI